MISYWPLTGAVDPGFNGLFMVATLLLLARSSVDFVALQAVLFIARTLQKVFTLDASSVRARVLVVINFAMLGRVLR